MFEKSKLIKKITNLRDKHRISESEMKEDLLNLHQIENYHFSLNEKFDLCKKFLDSYFEYNRLDLELDSLMMKMASDPIKYSNFFNINHTNIGDRSIFLFNEPYLYTQMDIKLLSDLSILFHKLERLQSVIHSIKNLRYIVVETEDQRE